MDENYKLAKWLSGEMSKEELSAFEAEPDYAIFEKIKNHSSQLEAPSFNEQKSLTRILASPKKKVKTIKNLNPKILELPQKNIWPRTVSDPHQVFKKYFW